MSDLIDPTRATSSALGRRAFTLLSAGAAAFGAGIASALAQGDDFGKPHPPIVPEDDPAIVVARPKITYVAGANQGGGSRTIDSYSAAPKGAGRSTPALVVVQAIWGIDAQLRDTVRRFAKSGFIAIAPDLYTGLSAPSGDGATDFAPFRDVSSRLSDDVVDADISATADLLRSGFANGAHEKIGVTGFCMGGGITLRQTVDNAAVFAAAAVFYGKVRYGTTDNKGTITPIALDYAQDIGVPLLGSWGERDTSILAADVRALDAKLATLRKPHDFRVYESAGHAFFDDTRESYVPSAAADAWTRTLAWFGKHLA